VTANNRRAIRNTLDRLGIFFLPSVSLACHDADSGAVYNHVRHRSTRSSAGLPSSTMKYGILFLILGGILILQAGMIGGVYWILVWPGLSFVAVAAAYFGLGPGVFGKQPDGTMAWYAVALLLPYLLLTWLTWHVARLISSENCCNKVVLGLYVGRRPLANEVPEDVTLIVDLTPEFAEVAAVRTARHYLAFPMLDTGVSSEAAFEQLVRKVADWQGPVYIHCAQGHGRTGLVAAAVLIAKGHAATAEEAVSLLTRARPRLSLGKNQLAFLRRIVRETCLRHSPHHTRPAITTRAFAVWLVLIVRRDPARHRPWRLPGAARRRVPVQSDRRVHRLDHHPGHRPGVRPVDRHISNRPPAGSWPPVAGPDAGV
jgi:protein-tyrosine phosphatase